MKGGISEKIRVAGGEIYAVSSEPQTLAGRAKDEWQLNFETIGDPHHDIAGTCRERGWLDLFANERLEFLQRSTSHEVDWKVTHPKGYFQPGVLALGRDGRVLYRWRSVPSRSNVGGAVERATAEHVWSAVAAALASGAPDAPLDTDPPLGSRGAPWPVFVALLLANGWFLRPRGFRATSLVTAAAVRLLAFITVWIAAFVWLPTLPVALCLAVWIAFITPRVRWVNQEFQDASGEAT